MDFIANTILQVYGSLILPMLLPILIFSIVISMGKPERLIEGVFGCMEAVFGVIIKGMIKLVVAFFRAIGQGLEGVARSSGRSKYPGGGSKNPSGGSRGPKKGPDEKPFW